MRTTITCLVGLLAWATAVMAAEPRPLAIGFAQDTLANDWRLAQAEGLKAALAGQSGVTLTITDGHGETARQIRDIEDLVYAKVDVLVASPRDGAAMTPVLSRAYRSGIPVVLLTRRISTDDYTSFIAPDDAAIARRAARYMAAQLKGEGRILMLQGVPTATTAIARTEAFLEELKQHPGVQVSAVKPANYLRADAIRAVEEAVREGVPFDAIYAQSDSMAAGARIALRKAGRDPARLIIVGIDYIAEAREAIRRGEQTASFTYPTCAAEAARVVLAIGRGEKVPKRVVVESIMVTRDNVEQVAPIF
ncbi:substrate-binding domain-containing protein [Sulfurivermis fontis]|uniref:substrate-binding domain-containing protein n=1 Tax=Sulfurivermis fontis TaxID=1972068 RepID=UPI000FD6F5F1|nr:substrate-binding domain-containing protein [Sulfurivermis fontis]